MSQKPTDNATTELKSVTPDETPETEVVVEKQSFYQRRIVTPIKKHPKIAIAVGGGLTLVGLAAFAGRKTAPDTTPIPDDSVEIIELENGFAVVEAEDTTVA